MQQRDLESVDYFFDPDILQDPYPYYDHMRAQGPVVPGMQYDAVAITGYEESVAVFNDTARFSNCNSMAGPFHGFPVRSMVPTTSPCSSTSGATRCR